MTTSNITQESIKEALNAVLYMPKSDNIVNLNMLKNIEITDGKIRFAIEIPERNKKTEDLLINQSVKALKSAFGADFSISANDIRVQLPQANDLSNIKNTIAVASGKGGVGKSTVAVNLAVALAKQGFKVGLLDADIYGPSIPTMLDLEDAQPGGKQVGEKQYIQPLEKYGVKCVSIGFFVEPEKALIWRGAMATGAIKQLYKDTAWGELDYLVIDLPPGTGDIHLTLVQTLSLTGSLVVTTPQKVALDDAVKAIAMFKQKDIEVPVLGLVENMSWFTPKELPEKKYYIFGDGGGKRLAEKEKISLLGEIPIVQGVRESGDGGKPIVMNSETEIAKIFMDIAIKLDKSVSERNENLPPTKRVIITQQ
jgi:ATP-binding protein involved in chromosome partitioning